MSAVFEDKVLASIAERLDKLQPDTPRKWGKMNVTQMLAHMNDALRISLGMKEIKDRSNLFNRHIVFPFGVYIMPAWPKGTMTAPEMNQDKKGTPARDFYTELEFLKKMLDIFNEREESKFKAHPMFGTLSKKQWRDLFVKHFDHHFRQFGV